MTAVWDPLSLTYQLRRGGSHRGLSYWSRWVDGDCERKLALNEQKADSGFFDSMPAALDSRGAAIGTLGHAFLHAWLMSERLDFDTIRFEPNTHPILSDDVVYERARNAVNAFATRYRREVFTGTNTHPEHEIQVENLFTCAPVTAAFDLDFTATPDQALLFGIQFNIDLVPGRRYLLDWKFKEASNDQIASSDYPIDGDLTSLQRIAYMHMAAMTGEPPAGFIHVFILRPKSVHGSHKVFAEIQGPPTTRELHVLEAFMRRAAENRERNWNKCNPKRCYDWRGKPCFYLNNGCERF